LLAVIAGDTSDTFAVTLSETIRAVSNTGSVVKIEAVFTLGAGLGIVAFETLSIALGTAGEFAGFIDEKSAGTGGVAKLGRDEDIRKLALSAGLYVSIALVTVVDIALDAGVSNDGLSNGTFVDAGVVIIVETGGAFLADLSVGQRRALDTLDNVASFAVSRLTSGDIGSLFEGSFGASVNTSSVEEE
jgi:hypothetical protein